MSALAAVAGILAALLMGAMSPGPSFVLVARNAIGLSRTDGLATARCLPEAPCAGRRCRACRQSPSIRLRTGTREVAR